MKVYELMCRLATFPAGYDVTFERLATKDEVPRCADDLSMYELDFIIRDVEQNDRTKRAVLDGWFE